MEAEPADKNSYCKWQESPHEAKYLSYTYYEEEGPYRDQIVESKAIL